MSNIKIIGGALAGMMFLSGCSSAIASHNAPAIETASVLSPTIETIEFPTSTSTNEAPTATPEATKSPYEIEVEKVYVMPPSYEDVVANPEKYQRSPDPLENIEVFKDWWLNKMIPALGYQNDKEMNLICQSRSYNDNYFYWKVHPGKSGKLLQTPQFFYFEHNGKVFPVLILTLGYTRSNSDVINGGTFAVILHEADPGQPGSIGLDAIRYLAEGKDIKSIMGSKKVGVSSLDQSIIDLINDGYNWPDYDGNIFTNNDSALVWEDMQNKFTVGVGEIWIKQ